ncbi:MAG TPA: alpha-ketoglutarate-dependent dioxygenase AlkB [Vicinamibacterales bacterium]|nr:alpha-ketoglutarate-dependent dioxygenase AlkB [Vicinamibacterales bacterium]
MASLFGPDLPDGFLYRPEFISPAEETALAGDIARIEFANFEMRGVVARRRVAFFGAAYDASTPARPMPEFLFPIRARLAAWAEVSAGDFAMALINEYRQGAPIGWHRDAPQYELVAGVTLLSAATMRLRPYVSPRALKQRARGPRRTATHEILLEPRSAYVMRGVARSQYEHHIPPVTALRYSITFRTLRPPASA